MSNRRARTKVTSGRRVTGVMVMMWGIITGSRASGLLRRRLVCFGRRPGGAGTMAFTHLTKVTGGRTSVFTGALITAMAITGTATGAADGTETTSSTTPL